MWRSGRSYEMTRRSSGGRDVPSQLIGEVRHAGSGERPQQLVESSRRVPVRGQHQLDRGGDMSGNQVELVQQKVVGMDGLDVPGLEGGKSLRLKVTIVCT